MLVRPPLKIWIALVAIVSIGLFAGVGCTDTTPGSGGANGQNDGENQTNNDNDGNNDQNINTTPNASNDNDGNNDSNNDSNNDTEPPCQNYECDQVECDDGQTTSLTGTVHIPSGQLPLPNANVYVPNDDLEPVEEGVSCQRCDEILTGDPLVETTTDYQGNFELNNIPVTNDVPLVIQSGSWRRVVELSSVDECQENTVSDPDKLRLPRNRDEGDIPNIAVTTGGWDALQCLTYDIGLDDSEFGLPGEDTAVTIYNNGGSTAYSAEFGGQQFPSADELWGDISSLQNYAVMLFSCSGGTGDAAVLEEYVDQGGRVFMTDLQKAWLEFGTDNFQNVATWDGEEPWSDEDGHVDTSFADGQTLYDWLGHVGALDQNGFLPLRDVVHQIGSVNEELATRWIYSDSGAGQQEHYFDFHTPVGEEEENQCGRVVYSDLHVVAAGDATPSGEFPNNCGSGDPAGQEQALLYMLFDLSGCVEPDCSEMGEGCKHDGDCCTPLWCDDESGDYVCTDRCRTDGERCSENSDCCSEACDLGGGDEGTCVPA